MKILLILVIAHLVVSQSVPNSSEQRGKKEETPRDLTRLQELQNRLQNARSHFKANASAQKSNLEDFKNSSRRAKNFPFFPFFPPPPLPFGVPPGLFFPQNKEIPDNTYPTEWLSRTEPFKKNPPLLDSPTYYIRLPPNPYIFIPGVGYVSRPPALSDPELLESSKPDHGNGIGNDVQDSFYKVPINFISNGKPTSVYQLPSGHTLPKPESSLVNLNKGPYVFNGKPSEIYLVAQIYDALYGDELPHFYP